QYLVLTANSTGAANTINISATSASSSALQGLAFTTTTGGDDTTDSTPAWTQTSPAADAEFTVNGTSATSASNAVTGVINGVTLNLTSAAVDKSGDGANAQTLTVAADTSSEITDVSNFVTAYNSLVSTVGTLTSFDPTSSSGSSAGPLLGNSLVNSLRYSLGNIVASAVSSSGQTDTLASLGVTLNDDGTLSLDTTTLSSAVVSDPEAVQTVFNLSNGIGAQLNNAITPYTEPDGSIDTNITSLTANLTSLTAQTTALTAYSGQLTSQYNAQFTALDSYMATTNSDEQYLTALFGGSDSAGSLATGSSS
ncbi:MAG: flagellar filament capping protein FliD, partial [Paraburkholderia sp.]